MLLYLVHCTDYLNTALEAQEPIVQTGPPSAVSYRLIESAVLQKARNSHRADSDASPARRIQTVFLKIDCPFVPVLLSFGSLGSSQLVQCMPKLGGYDGKH